MTKFRAFWMALYDTVERAGAQWLQCWAALLVDSRFFDDFNVSTAKLALIASAPAGISALVALATARLDELELPKPLQFLYRVGRTGAAAYVGFALALPMYSLEVGFGPAARATVLAAVGGALKAGVGGLWGSDVAWRPSGWTAPNDDGSVVLPDYDPNADEELEPGTIPVELLEQGGEW